jgi:hypothetical protein
MFFSKNKIISLFISLCIIASVVFFLYRQNRTAIIHIEPTTTEIKNTSATPLFQWKLQSLDSDNVDIPQSHVVLQFKNQTHDMGIFQGNCFQISESEWKYVENEIDGVICWWAGGGVEIGVFKTQDGFAVKKAFIGEGESDLVRANFQTVFLLNK